MSVIDELDKNILSIGVSDTNITDSGSLSWTVEMHVYDLSENKILSVHEIPSGSWELYNYEAEALTIKIPNNTAVQQS